MHRLPPVPLTKQKSIRSQIQEKNINAFTGLLFEYPLSDKQLLAKVNFTLNLTRQMPIVFVNYSESSNNCKQVNPMADSKPITERRRFTRIPFEASATLSNPSGSWTAKLLDVSLNGALITLPQNWPPTQNESYLLEINVADNIFKIKMEATATHVDSERIGLRCDHIDIDSASHLRRLVELNLGDEEILNRELAALLNHAA